MADTKIHNLFPTPVYTTGLDYIIPQDELNFIKSQDFQQNKYNHRSIDSYLLEREELSTLRNEIDKHVQFYFKEVYQPNNQVSLHITQSWCNKTFPGEMHHKHAHTNSLVSGVYYISANPNTDSIWFDKGIFNPLEIEPVTYNIHNASTWYYPVSTGMLVLFPSSLLHYVDIVQEDQERESRMSLSFNTFIKGSIGSEFFLSELNV